MGLHHNKFNQTIDDINLPAVNIDKESFSRFKSEDPNLLRKTFESIYDEILAESLSDSLNNPDANGTSSPIMQQVILQRPSYKKNSSLEPQII